MAHGLVKLTIADYRVFPDDGRRHELIEGRHVVTPAPSVLHQRVSRNVFRALDRFLEVHPIGEVLFAPVDVILSDSDVVRPDASLRGA